MINKILGCTLDQSLSCESMVHYVIKRANARLKILYRKRDFLTMHTKSFIFCFKSNVILTMPGFLVSMSFVNVWNTSFQLHKISWYELNLDFNSRINDEHFKTLNWLLLCKRVAQVTFLACFYNKKWYVLPLCNFRLNSWI